MLWCCATSETLNDSHLTAAAGASVLWRLRHLRGVLGPRLRTDVDGFDGVDRNYRREREQQFAGAGDVRGTLTAVEHSIIADAVETCGQHVHQETADELVGIDRHRLVTLGAFDPVVLPFEGDAVLAAGD